MSRKKIVGLFLSLGISVGCLAYLFHELDWSLFFAEFGAMKLWYVPILLAVFYSTFVLRALRWRHLLPHDANYKPLYDAYSIGTLATTILPFRAGEVIRPFFLSRWERISFGTALASIVTERVFDVLMLLLFLILALMRFENLPDSIILGARALTILTGAISLVMIVAYVRGDWVLKLGIWTLTKALPERFAKALGHFLEEFIGGLRAIRGIKELALVLIWSLGIWVLYALYFYLGLVSFGVTPSPWVGVLVSVCIALAIAAPSSPGFVGTFQFGCVLALTGISGYRKEFSLAYSVIIHAAQTVVMVIAGAIVLNQRGLSFSKLQHVQEEIPSS